MNRRRKKRDIKYYIAAVAIMFFLSWLAEITEEDRSINKQENSQTEQESQAQGEDDFSTGTMSVHFLDVGQGLCIIAIQDDNVLIYDGGDSDTSSFVVSYLKQLGITKIDYMISSHYDSDHLSGLIGCLNAFEVKNVIGSNYDHNTNLYDSFMRAVEDEGLKMQYPEVGETFTFGDAQIIILAPTEIGSDSNANSVAIKLVYGENSFIFTGDANVASEKEMVQLGINLECDVLSAGHHGSSTSSSSLFLEKTVPEYVVISCGADNNYGHPHVEVVELLEAMEIDLFRNDIQGTVIATTNGNKITWSDEPCNDYTDGD